MDLIKDPQDCEAKIETDEQQTHLIDRGGLWHMKESTYQFFSCCRARNQRWYTDHEKSLLTTEARDD